jgi:ribonuclease HI
MIEIFTDGACSINPGKGGYGIVMKYKQHYKELSGGFLMTTNNRMELLSVIIALEAIRKPKQIITITSDSKYVVEAINQKWVYSWEKKEFKGRPNVDLWKRLLILLKLHTVTFVWVKGHASHVENERCDVLAVTAYKQSNLETDAGYEETIKADPAVSSQVGEQPTDSVQKASQSGEKETDSD